MKGKVRVLVIATSRKTRGGITAVVKAYEQADLWKRYHCKWIETHIDKCGFYKILYFIRGLFKFIFTAFSFDLIHIHMSEPSSAIRKVIFMWFSNLMHKKTIVHFHSYSSETTIYSKYKWIYRYLFVKTDCVLVLSEYWKKEINDAFELGDKVRIIYNPCVEPHFEKYYKKQKQILYAGTVNVRKGYCVLIKSFAKIAAKYSDWQIVFAGNGEVEQGKALAKELRIDDQVIFLGWVNGAAKDKTFQEASIFCLPSYAEGFPMSVLDALAYGLPMVTTPVGGLPDVLVHEKNSMVFEPGNINTLAEHLETLILNESLSKKLSKASLELSNEQFNIKTITQQLSVLYDDLIDSSR